MGRAPRTNIARQRCLTWVNTSTRATLLRSTEDGDNQVEIASLEERLRQLKSEDSSIEEGNIERIALESQPAVADDTSERVFSVRKGGDNKLPNDMGGELEGESETSVMFSERWKEAKEGYAEKSYVEKMDSNLGGIGKICLGIVFVLCLGFFSQVPVGEESLQRYQDVKGNPSRIDLGDLNPDS